MLYSVQLEIINCIKCPHCQTSQTPKAGAFALDYFCVGDPNVMGKRKIKGYVEIGVEMPQDHEIPDFCPLRK